MPPLTSHQILVLASQFSDMADYIDDKAAALPPDDPMRKNYAMERSRLSAASTDLCGTGIQVKLNELAPHYDAMLSVLRDLNAAVKAETRFVRVLKLVGAAMSIATASMAGNIPGVVSAIGDAKAVLTS